MTRVLFRRRRAWPWLAGFVAGLLVVALVALVLSRGGDDAADVGLGDPTATPSATASEATESPSPSATASPTVGPPATASASASPSASPGPAASPTATASASPTRSAAPGTTAPPGDRPDGRPGWQNAVASCRQAGAPGASTAPYPGLAVELVLPTNSFRTGFPVSGTVRVTNGGTETLRFRSYDAGDDGTLLDAGRPVSAVYSGARATVEWAVPPGESQERQVTVEAERCGDTSGSAGTPLPTDRAYQAVVTLVWETAAGSGRWTTEPRTVTLFR